MTLSEALQGVSVACFDSSAIIDHAEGVARSARLLSAFFRRIEAGEITGHGTVLLAPEVLHYAREEAAEWSTPSPDVRVIEGRFTTVYSLLSLHPVSWEIAQVAADFRRDYALKTDDAVHLATAVYIGADAFITCDSDFLRAQGIPVGNPGANRTLKIINALKVT